MSTKIHKIALTGGPGSGKSTSLECLAKKIEEHNYKVFVVPEAATLMFLGGIDLRVVPFKERKVLQTNLMKFMIAMEDAFFEIAKASDKDSVIIYDRGLLDPLAFMDKEMWLSIAEDTGWTPSRLRDRYDAVILLLSAANGAEEHYTAENNKARAETPAQAIEIDNKLQEAWLGHPHLRVIGACSEFSDKLRKIINVVYKTIGIPEPIEYEKKYLIKSKIDISVPYNDSLIEQTYLTDGSRIRCRSFGDCKQYTKTIKETISAGKNKENENIINYSEYCKYLELADPNSSTIMKIRRCFLYEKQYFEYDIYIQPHNGLTVLEIELDSDDQDVIMPRFITDYEDVTGNEKYSNINLAKKNE